MHLLPDADRLVGSGECVGGCRAEPSARLLPRLTGRAASTRRWRNVIIPPTPPTCGRFISWWDGEYEGNCELPEGHDGDHYDGLSWFNNDNENTDYLHEVGK